MALVAKPEVPRWIISWVCSMITAPLLQGEVTERRESCLARRCGKICVPGSWTRPRVGSASRRDTALHIPMFSSSAAGLGSDGRSLWVIHVLVLCVPRSEAVCYNSQEKQIHSPCPFPGTSLFTGMCTHKHTGTLILSLGS